MDLQLQPQHQLHHRPQPQQQRRRTPVSFRVAVWVYVAVIRWKRRREIYARISPHVKRLLRTRARGAAQRSEEWFNERTKRLTASAADAVIGMNPYKSRKSVLKEKTTPAKPRTTSIHARHGIKYEDEAIAKFEHVYGKRVYTFGLMKHQVITWLGASPDGICGSGEMVEVKCPTTREILPAAEYRLGCPLMYYGQVQLQLQVADLQKCYFVQYRPGNEWLGEVFEVSVVHREGRWWEIVYPIFKQFWDEVRAFRRAHSDWATVDHYRQLARQSTVSMDDLILSSASTRTAVDTACNASKRLRTTSSTTTTVTVNTATSSDEHKVLACMARMDASTTSTTRAIW